MEGIVELRTAINRLAGIDPARLSNQSLEALIVGLHREAARLVSVQAKVTAAFDLRRAWRDDGSRSMGAWLQRRCHTSGRASRAQVRRAKRLRGMPVTSIALAGGKIDDQHVGVLSQLAASPRRVIAEAFMAAEEMLVGFAKELEFGDFVAACRHWEDVVDPDGSEDQASDDVAARRLHVSETFRGNVVIDGFLDPISGAVFTTALRRIENELFQADWAAAKEIHGDGTRGEHLARSAAQRRADALVEMAKRAAIAPADGSRPRPLFVFHVGYESSARRMCELANGTVVPPGQLVAHLADADFERIVWGPGDRIISLSKTARFFTGGLRRVIQHRDRRCTTEGCREPAENCDIDHIQPHTDGGETTQDNAQLKCPRHNRHAYTTYKQIRAG